jgi:hypothetical protein
MPDLKLLNIQEGRIQARPDFVMAFDGAGRFLTGPEFVSGSDVAVQDVVRGLLTLIDTNRLAPNFGTSISELIGSRDFGSITGPLTDEVQKILGYIAQNAAESDPSEQINQILSLRVKQEERTLVIELELQTNSGETATVTIS